jgi:solute carrier family 10 (sodium/bile acid cotransporter), member 7
MAINMVVVLTKASDGDEAAAVFNASIANLLGVFLSPVLILAYLGVKGNIKVVDFFYKVALRVLLPILIGQILRNASKAVRNFVNAKKNALKLLSQNCLVFIVYTVFCSTFQGDSRSSFQEIFLMSEYACLAFIWRC